MLKWRLLLGVVFVAGLVGLCVADGMLAGTKWGPGVALCPLAVLVAWGAAEEVVKLCGAGGYKASRLVVVGGAVALVAASAKPWWGAAAVGVCPVVVAGLVVVLALGEAVLRYQPKGRSLERAAWGVFGVAYVGGLMCFVVQLRFLGPAIAQVDYGMAALISLIAVVKMGDTGAYTVGRLVGRHKMTPALSPGKTWEGAAGGLVFACLGAWVSLHFLAPGSEKTWGWLIYGVVVGIAGMLGDLAESMMKRDVGVKDSSPWMPGFGGILDLLDSILFAAPVAYLLWIAGVVGY